MNDVIIISGGTIQTDFALTFLKKRIKPDTCIIAADRGLEFLAETEYMPDVVVGDFDSLSERGSQYLDSLKNTEILRLKPEKDDSDTQSAANYAMDRGAKRITVLGATGNRIDHLLANFGLLVMAKNKGTSMDLVDQYNYIRLIESGTVLQRETQFGKYVSFFSIGGDVTGLTLKGFKYPLDGHRLTPSDSGLTVSNEITDTEAEVTFDGGTLLMFMTRD